MKQSEFSRLTQFKKEVVEGQRDQEKQHYAAMLKQAQERLDDHQLRMQIGKAVETTQESAGWPFIEAILYKRIYAASESIRKESGDALRKALVEYEIMRDVLMEISNLIQEGTDSEAALHRKMKEREEKNNE